MLRIAVCGSDPEYMEELQEMMLAHPDVERVDTFSDMDALLLSARNKGNFFHVILLDTPPIKQVGILENAERLYDLAPKTRFIFMLAPGDNFFQYIPLRQIQLLGYLVKPVKQELLSRYLNKIAQRQGEEEFFSFYSRGKQYSLALENVLYFESHNHVVIVHAMGASQSFYAKLGSLNLPRHFIQCHKSYIVNLKRVIFQGPNELILVSGAVIPISRNFREITQKAIRNYHGDSE